MISFVIDLEKKPVLRSLCADSNVELWFSDECGVEGDRRPWRRRVQPGKRMTVPYLGDHILQNVIGFVVPQSGAYLASSSMASMPTSFNSFWMKWLNRSQKTEGVRQLLILDNAS
jgi:hypothetical protein